MKRLINKGSCNRMGQSRVDWRPSARYSLHYTREYLCKLLVPPSHQCYGGTFLGKKMSKGRNIKGRDKGKQKVSIKERQKRKKEKKEKKSRWK